MAFFYKKLIFATASGILFWFLVFHGEENKLDYQCKYEATFLKGFDSQAKRKNKSQSSIFIAINS